MKKTAFTLAEVLITLGIIGVVAAMTLPSVIANYQKKVYANQLKASVNILTNGVKQYMADHGVDNLDDTDITNGADELKKFFYDYFKVVNDCDGRYFKENQYNCFSHYYTTIKGSSTPVNMQPHSCNVTLNLANGMSVCSDVVEGRVEGGDGDDHHANNGVLGNSAISFEIDINGAKGPNKFGRDFFAFSIKANGVPYDPTWEETNALDLSIGTNSGATGYLMSNGWEMDY